jgi:threonine/homoserine efflux transporter RhtA
VGRTQGSLEYIIIIGGIIILAAASYFMPVVCRLNKQGVTPELLYGSYTAAFRATFYIATN